MKKLFAVLAVLVLMLGAIGCNEPDPYPYPEDPGSSPAQQPQPGPATATGALEAGLSAFASGVGAAGGRVDVGNALMDEFFASMVDVYIEVTGEAAEYISDDKSSVRLIVDGKRIYCGLADGASVELGQSVTLKGRILDISLSYSEDGAAFSLWRCEQLAGPSGGSNFSGSGKDLAGVMGDLAAYFSAGGMLNAEFSAINAFCEAVATAEFVVSGTVTEYETVDNSLNSFYMDIDGKTAYFFLDDGLSVRVGDKITVAGVLLSISSFASEDRVAYTLDYCKIV